MQYIIIKRMLFSIRKHIVYVNFIFFVVQKCILTCVVNVLYICYICEWLYERCSGGALRVLCIIFFNHTGYFICVCVCVYPTVHSLLSGMEKYVAMDIFIYVIYCT